MHPTGGGSGHTAQLIQGQTPLPPLPLLGSKWGLHSSPVHRFKLERRV